MPRIGEALGILFYVYAEDHDPPHVHAIYGSEQALLVIATGDPLAGSLPGKQVAPGTGVAGRKPSRRAGGLGSPQSMSTSP